MAKPTCEGCNASLPRSASDLSGRIWAASHQAVCTRTKVAHHILFFEPGRSPNKTKRVSVLTLEDASSTFAATAPLESLRFMISRCMTGASRQPADVRFLRFYDISRGWRLRHWRGKSCKLAEREARPSRRDHQWEKASPMGSSSVEWDFRQNTEGCAGASHWDRNPARRKDAGWWDLLRT